MARNTGLGKGLGALIPNETPTDETATPPRAKDLRRVPVQSIRPNPYQPRKAINDESLWLFASSVKDSASCSRSCFDQSMAKKGTTNSSPANGVGEGDSRRIGIHAGPRAVDVNDRLSLEQAVVENLHRVDLHRWRRRAYNS